MKRLSKIAAFVALVVPSNAFGATLDQSVSFGGGNAFASDFFNSFTRYDGPETLVGVELIYNYTSSGTASADLCNFYQDCDPALADITLQGAGAFSGFSVVDTDGTGITNNTNFNQVSSFSLSLDGSFDDLILSDFSGTGNVSGWIDADGGYAGYSLVTAASHNGTLILRYTTDVTPVPLPASLGMLLIGTSGLGLLARRRRNLR